MTHDLIGTDGWEAIVAQLGGAAELAASARAHRAFVRARGVKDPVSLLRLILLYGPGGYSLRGTAAVAAAASIAHLTDVSLLDRLRGSVGWLEALCAERLRAIADSVGVASPQAIRIVDATRIEGPGGRAFRLHLAYDLREGRISDALLTDLSAAEQLTRSAVRAGEIRLADRGYPKPDALAATLAAGADVIVRVTWKSLRLQHPDGTPLVWDQVFAAADVNGCADVAVSVDKGRPKGGWQALPMRLVALPKPPASATRSREKVRRTSLKDQTRLDPRTLRAADYVLLLTSLPPQRYTAQQIGALYRLRWQIELAFKRLKAILRLDQLPAKDPDLARTWILSHLLIALLSDEQRVRLDAFFP